MEKYEGKICVITINNTNLVRDDLRGTQYFRLSSDES